MWMLCAAFLMALPAIANAAPAPDGVAARDIVIQAPSQNVDGSPLIDLASMTIYHGFASRTYEPATANIIYSQAGGTVTRNVVVNVVGNYGDVVTVFYAATATDARGNESAFSVEIQEQWEIVDATTPDAPSIQFSVPVTKNCVTPDGDVCQLRRVG